MIDFFKSTISGSNSKQGQIFFWKYFVTTSHLLSEILCWCNFQFLTATNTMFFLRKSEVSEILFILCASSSNWENPFSSHNFKRFEKNHFSQGDMLKKRLSALNSFSTATSISAFRKTPRQDNKLYNLWWSATLAPFSLCAFCCAFLPTVVVEIQAHTDCKRHINCAVFISYNCSSYFFFPEASKQSCSLVSVFRE